MSILGNAIMLGGGGGGNNSLVGMLWGTVGSTSYTTVGTVLESTAASDADYFTYSSGVFTCQKAGTYNLQILARGSWWSVYYDSQYNPHYSVVGCSYQVMKNGSTLSGASGTASNGNGTTNIVSSVSLAVGDTLSVQIKRNTSDNVQVEAALFISVG